MICRVCASEMQGNGTYIRCATCTYWASTLPADVESTSRPDSDYELVSYEPTRKANYTAILDLLADRHAAGSTLLEIGCADGLFLAMAKERGYVTLGIEPNEKMMNGNPLGQDIRRGFFPAALEGSEQTFDIIALNCVFEHVPDVDDLIEAFKRYLKPGGSVMINVPVASGLMFKLSRALYRVGVRYPFDRIWQKGFVSPHLHYFTEMNLELLFANHGLSLVGKRRLALFSLGGMYARLGLDPRLRAGRRVVALASLYAYYPLSKVVPDARAFVFSALP